MTRPSRPANGSSTAEHERPPPGRLLGGFAIALIVAAVSDGSVVPFGPSAGEVKPHLRRDSRTGTDPAQDHRSHSSGRSQTVEQIRSPASMQCASARESKRSISECPELVAQTHQRVVTEHRSADLLGARSFVEHRGGQC
jgi:hypothetical protein